MSDSPVVPTPSQGTEPTDPTEPADGDGALGIRHFQERIRARYGEPDSRRGTPGTFMWFIEEVGELATALQKAHGEGGATSGGEDLAGEFADVLAWLCTLANINGVDLEAAVRAKYYQRGGPSGHK